MGSIWWSRNRLWLGLLLPALALALATSAFRLVNLYLPWEWTRPTYANGTTGTLRQEFLSPDHIDRTRIVTVTVEGLRRVDSYDGSLPAPGAALWVLDVSFSADPDQLLKGCTMALVDAAGVVYSAGNEGQISDNTDVGWDVRNVDCVPPDTPGPSFLGTTLEVPETPRPESWLVSAPIALPVGVTPSTVRVAWIQPDYLVLDIPG